MTSPIDNEWLKNVVSLGVGVLVGIVLGLFSALFIEPMKFRRLRKIQAAEARDLIYEELGAILASLKLSIPMGNEACKALIRRFPNQRYDFYFKDRREVFYAIPKAQGIWGLHAQLLLNREPETEAKYGAVHCVREMIAAFDFAMSEREVDKERIERAEKKCYDKADEQGDRLIAHIRKNNEKNP
jgi:hypothetical protein